MLETVVVGPADVARVAVVVRVDVAIILKRSTCEAEFSAGVLIWVLIAI